MIALRSPSQNRVFRNQNLCVPCQLLHVLGLRPTQPGDLAEWSFSLQDHPALSVVTDKLGWWGSNTCCLHSTWHFWRAAEDQTCAMLSFRQAMLPERTGRPGLLTPFMSGTKPLDVAMDGEEGWINPSGGLSSPVVSRYNMWLYKTTFVTVTWAIFSSCLSVRKLSKA